LTGIKKAGPLFFGVGVPFVFCVEFFNSSGGINYLCFAGVERMTAGTDFYVVALFFG